MHLKWPQNSGSGFVWVFISLSWDCDSDSVETSPGPLPKHMRDEKSDDSPKCTKQGNFGTSSKISLHLPTSCPAIRSVPQISGSAVFCSPAMGCHLCPMSLQPPLPHVTAVTSHLRSAPLLPLERCLLPQIVLGKFPGYLFPKQGIPQGSKGQSSLLAEQSYITHFVFCSTSRHCFQEQRQGAVPPFHTSSDELWCPW